MSIFLDAIQRLVEPQEVTNPKLVFIVGCLGLLSNFVGLMLFHDHSHGHEHSHAEGTEQPLSSAEQGYTTGENAGDTAAVSDQGGAIAGVMPENALSTCQTEPRSTAGQGYSRRRGSRGLNGSTSRGYRDVDDIYTHPASLRQDIITASRFEDEPSEADSAVEPSNGAAQSSERSPLLSRGNDNTTRYSAAEISQSGNTRTKDFDDLHKSHNHAQPKPKKNGHSHDLNMRGVFLHVIGDALGNIGVIASALVIWLTSFSWRHYVDPGISLFITVIILWSAIPLCKAASRILLQAVPPGMSVDHIIEDIELLPGVVSCHHLHVWQLSDTQLVSSLHIRVSHGIKGEGSDRYMELARQVRSCLHAYGIHSSTIQPEFAPYPDYSDTPSPSSTGVGNDGTPQGSTDQRSSAVESPACLLDCRNVCGPAKQCCPPSDK